MELTIKVNGQAVSVAVTVEVYEYLDQAEHKDENLAHEQRRQRFFLYALEGMSYAEIGRYCGCSKNAVMQSISAVRKKYQEFLKRYMYETLFTG